MKLNVNRCLHNAFNKYIFGLLLIDDLIKNDDGINLHFYDPVFYRSQQKLHIPDTGLL